MLEIQNVYQKLTKSSLFLGGKGYGDRRTLLGKFNALYNKVLACFSFDMCQEARKFCD